MASENLQEWGSTIEVIQETVRAVVQAFADGLIELEAPEKKTKKSSLRYAPSFATNDAQGRDPEHAYTGVTIAKFLGWPLTERGDAPERVSVALNASQDATDGHLVSPAT